MIHEEVVTATAEGCNCCKMLQVGAMRAHSLQQDGALSRGTCTWGAFITMSGIVAVHTVCTVFVPCRNLACYVT